MQILAVALITSTVVAQANPRLHSQNCAKYYEPRIDFLLGCCGDLELGYPGPRFPASMNQHQRATLALHEINSALSRDCGDHKSPEYVSILLDRVGAYLLRASGSMDASDGAPRVSEATEATKGAEMASVHLRDFVNDHPSESRELWHWIVNAYIRAGRPWSAVQFLTALPARCCDAAAIARTEGDLLFDLRQHAKAASAYALWLELTKTSAIGCDEKESARRAASLRDDGFPLTIDKPKPVGAVLILCGPGLDWVPYVRATITRP